MQEAQADAQRMLLIKNEIYVKLSWDIYSKVIIEENLADYLNIFPMTLNTKTHMSYHMEN